MMLSTRISINAASPVRLIATSTSRNARGDDTNTIKPVDTSRSGVNDKAVVPDVKRSGLSFGHKAGTGGRASFSGNVVTVFGANGYVGGSLINRITKDGTQIVIPYRCDPMWVRDLKVNGDLGQILFFPFSLTDEESIRKAVKYSNVVVNLIGTSQNTPNASMYDVNVDGAARLARISREMGVERFVHVSALNASHKPEAHMIPGGSHFLRSKAAGEDAVREHFPNATIVRPSGIYGIHGKWLLFALHAVRRIPFSWIELYKGGEYTYKMPVYNTDVAAGITRIVSDRAWDGQTIEFVGPHSLKLSEIANYCMYMARISKTHDSGVRPLSALTMTKASIYHCYNYYRKRKAIFDFETLEHFEATSDRLTGVPLLSDVLGSNELHHFEWMCRLQATRRTVGISTHKFREIDGHVDDLPPLNHYPILYANKLETDTRTFAAFDATASPFSTHAI